MKRIIAIFLLLTIIPVYAFADMPTIDFRTMTNEELISLETIISEEKLARKMVKSAKLGAGTYTVGKDIPAGSYTITDDSKYSMNIFVYKNKADREKDIRIYNLILWGNGEKTGKIELEEGNVLDINQSIILTVFEGVIWE